MVVILDFGSQYTQLIAKTTRRLGVYSEILPFNAKIEVIVAKNPKAIILSGSPHSVTKEGSPEADTAIYGLGIPILGICYGMQLITKHFGGQVQKSEIKEYGYAELKIEGSHPLFEGLQESEKVWMSHGDAVTLLPRDFFVIAKSEKLPHSAIAHKDKAILGLQFHPEVKHSESGEKVIANFLKNISGCSCDWTPHLFIEKAVADIKETVGDSRVLLGLSGGVDSSVTAALLAASIGDKLIAVFVDTGLLRKNEGDEVEAIFSDYNNLKFVRVNARDLFLNRLKGIIDPEQKRKIIGNTFIEIFEEEGAKYSDIKFLAQGTLYPDVIESVSVNGPSATIKSHHNVGGLPEKMKYKVIEPLRELFKDEVREVGHELGLPDYLIHRHPFPGPGLAVRIPGLITPERVKLLQEIDYIYIEELKKHQLYDEIWQAFAVLLPVQSVGVMGDERTYDFVCAIRAVNSSDGMTADWYEFPSGFLKRLSNRIINEVNGVNRVVYDISSKPPATIEWE